MNTTPNLLRLLTAFLSAATLFLARSTDAATFTLNPTADAFVMANNGANNYGGAGALGISAAGSPQGQFQSVIQFNLAAAKSSFDAQYGAGQWTIQSVTLSLAATSPGNPIFNANVAGQFGVTWMQNDSWVEGTGTPAAPITTGITFATLPSFLGGSDEGLGTFSFAGGTSGSTTNNLSLTSGFSADVLGGGLVSLDLFAADASVSYLFNSRSFGTASLRPVLAITAVPEPGTIGLAGLGGAILLRRKYSRKNRRG